MSKSLIRHAAGTDFPTLLSIDKASFEPGIAYDSRELAYYMNRDGAATLVAEIDGRIAGFILLEIHRRKRTATVVTLDVLAENRRRGIGSQLLNASEEMLRNNEVRRCELQVDVNNRDAVGFYVKSGFEVVHLLPHYYSNGNDAYLMAKKIL